MICPYCHTELIDINQLDSCLESYGVTASECPNCESCVDEDDWLEFVEIDE